MARGIFRKKQLKAAEQFWELDNLKLQMSLSSLVDKYSEQTRTYVFRCYNDSRLMMIYKNIRTSGVYEKGGAYRRKLVEFPNGWVYDFVDTVLSAIYGPRWLSDKKALYHELVRPWWVVNKL